MSDQKVTQAPFTRCVRCQSGCIHLMCGNVTFTLTPVEFLVLAEQISAMRHQLKEESRRAREESAQYVSFTM